MAPDDRVLVTSLEDASSLQRWAALLTSGALVGLGTLDQVRAARRLCASFDNVMFIEGGRQEIPWQEAWFTLILDSKPEDPTPEMARVLAPQGQVLPISG
ncbi:MAG: hypothetical protein HY821_18745 [Acidobacteria bacterium]|nr:hypothetical protein [Acidobacteriota bacterium]